MKLNFLPLLYISIAIPFFRVTTAIMRKADYDMVTEYVNLRIEVYKWHFDFCLYERGKVVR